MKQRVYIETSVLSYLTARRSRDVCTALVEPSTRFFCILARSAETYAMGSSEGRVTRKPVVTSWAALATRV